VEWDLSVEGASDLEAVDRDKWSARKGFWFPQANPVLFRVRRWARQEVSVAGLSRQSLGPQSLRLSHSGKPKTPAGEMTLRTQPVDAAFTALTLEAGDAACGEPARPWTASDRLLALFVWVRCPEREGDGVQAQARNSRVETFSGCP